MPINWNPPGSLYTPGFEYTRHRFAILIESLAPEVLTGLLDGPWKTYRFIEGYGPHRLASFANLLLAKNDTAISDQLEQLERELLDWSRGFHLSPDHWTTDPQWVLDAALLSMYNWRNGSIKPVGRRWTTGKGGFFENLADDDEIVEQPPEFDPTQYKNERDYLAAVKAHRQDLQERYKLQPVIRKNNSQHFTWLVYYQVKKWTYNDILDYESQKAGATGKDLLTDDAVKKALKRTATTLGMKLRKPERKQKSS